MKVFRSINSLQNPSQDGWVEVLDLTSIPTFGAVPLGFVVVGAVLRDRTAVDAGLLSGVAQISTLGVTALLKEVVGRKRPFETLSGVLVKHQWSATGNSFPSGHTSQAFTVATILSLRYSRLSVTIPLLAWASAIGYARIYLGLHYPSDVLAGGVVGSAMAFAVWSLRPNLAHLAESISGEPRIGLEPIPPSFEIVQIRIPF